jgi:hypothetical protein
MKEILVLTDINKAKIKHGLKGHYIEHQIFKTTDFRGL